MGITQKEQQIHNPKPFLYFFETHDNRIKLLFDDKLQQYEWDNAIDELTDLVKQNYLEYPNDPLTQKFNKLGIQAKTTVYSIISNGKIIYITDIYNEAHK